MLTMRSASTGTTAALLFAALTSPLAAQYGARGPIVHVYSQSGPLVSNYVQPGIQVSEDAYVFAVSMDVNGQIQVLHPDNPGISVRLTHQQPLRLPNFFGGYQQPGTARLDASGQYVNSLGYADDENDSRGTVIALASRAPFNLGRVESGGDWNILAIRNLIERRDPAAAAQALASYLGAKGEPIGADYMRFAGGHQNYYASDASYSCGVGYDGSASAITLRRHDVLERVDRMQRSGSRVSVIGYDACGMPIVAYGPSHPAAVFYGTPAPRRDRSDAIANGRGSRRSARQGGAATESSAAASLPSTEDEEPQESGDATFFNESNDRGRERRQTQDEHRIDFRAGALPPTTGIPLERRTPRRAETTVIGVMAPHETPRPIVRAATPAPARGH